MTDPTHHHQQPARPGDLAPAAWEAYTARVAAATAATAAHLDAARGPASILAARARTLVSNGVDLRHPERATDFISDQISTAVKDARLPGCECGGDLTAAAFALIAELTRQLAEATR